ncbi:MAG TPA: hypothetical protein VIL16_22815, partial [Trebonia sp.]
MPPRPRATLHYYFSGRDDLLSFLLAEHTQHGAEAMRAAVRGGDGPEARLMAMVTALAGTSPAAPARAPGYWARSARPAAWVRFRRPATRGSPLPCGRC